MAACESLGGVLTSAPAAAGEHQGRNVAVVVRGTDNACWRTVVQGSVPR